MWGLGVVYLESSPKKAAKGNKPGKGGNRFWKNIGLGFKTPREAIEGIVLGVLFNHFPGVFVCLLGHINCKIFLIW